MTIIGVQRRWVIETVPNVEAGRPGGLYGANALLKGVKEELQLG